MGRGLKKSPAYLGLDTSLKGLKMAIFSEEGGLLASYTDFQNPASCSLTLALKALLRAYNLNLEEIKGFMVIKGPGSFTGLKVGVSFVKGLALSMDRPVVAVTTLKALALTAVSLTSLQEGEVTSLLPALKGELFYTHFFLRDGKLEELSTGLGKPFLKEEALKVTGGRLEELFLHCTGCLYLPYGPLLESWGREGVNLFRERKLEDPVLLEPCYGRDPEIRKPITS